MREERSTALKHLLSNVFRPRNLRRGLMSYLGAVWLVMMLFIGIGVVAFIQRTESEAWRGRQSEAARSAAATVAAFIQRANDMLALLGGLGRDELARDPETISRVLRYNPALQEVVYLDDLGVVAASAFQDRPLLADLFTIPQSRWFLTARSGRPFYGSLQISARDEPYLIIALPVPDGVVAARLRMDVLWEVVADIRFGMSGRAYVVTRQGQIIAHTNPQVVLANTDISTLPELFAALQQPAQVWHGEFVDLEGIRVVGVTAAVPGTDWVVITELPQAEAYATSRTAFFLLGGGMLLFLALTMAASARFLERMIFVPMESLRAGSERIGQGDLSHRIAIIGQDEVSQVAAAFNAMAGNLDQRNMELAAKTAALRQQNEFLSALYETTLALMNRLEVESVLEQIVARAAQLIGTPDGYIYLAVPGAEEIETRVGRGVFERRIGYRLGVGQGLAGRVWQSGQPLVVEDYDAWAGRGASYPYHEVHAVMGVPLKAGAQVVGVLGLSYADPARRFGADQVEVLDRFAQLASIALDNAQLYTAAQQELAERKEAEEALRKLNEELEDRVKARTLELVNANQELQAEIAERRRVEAALRESEEKYRLHFENVTDVVYSLDPELRVYSVSPSVERHLGYKPQDLIGRPIQELNIVTTECLEAAFVDLSHIFGGGRVDSATYEFIAKDGTRLIGEVSGAPLVRNGQVTAAVCVARDITERVQAEERIKASLHEKEVLLQEIHHRVKNNLQVISSLLKLQSRQIEDPQTLEIFKDSQHRIRTMALIHEKLYRSGNLAQINFAEYIRELTTFLFHSYGIHARGVSLTIQADQVPLSIDNAVPCGLILNELISNALKHAFPPGQERLAGPARPADEADEIQIELRQADDKTLTLVVADNGIGWPPDLDFCNTSSFGLQLVNNLVKQLEGSIELDSRRGTQFKIKLAAL